MKNSNLILVSIVCYRNPKEVIGFVSSLKKQKNINNVHVVITCSSKNDYDEIKDNLNDSISKEMFLIDSNLGYLNSCLYGINNSKIENYKFAMITNTDVEFIENDYFNALISMPIEESVWSIGTSIISKNDKRQTNPLMISEPSKTIMKIKRIVFCNKILYKTYNFYYYLRNKFISKSNDFNAETGYVYAVHGSSFLLHPECINKLSNVAKNIFMYGEEELIAALIKKNNKKVLFINELHVDHKCSTVTSGISDKIKFNYYKKSYKYLYDYIYNE